MTHYPPLFDRPPSFGVDGVTTFPTGIVHKARGWPWTKRAAIACNEHVRMGLDAVDPDGEFTEAYCERLAKKTGQPHSLCCHCREREPCWDRWLRERGH